MNASQRWGCTKTERQGLDGFDFWLVVAAFFSYVLLLIDLAIWSVKGLLALRANSQSR
jgi:hypothetical protein